MNYCLIHGYFTGNLCQGCNPPPQIHYNIDALAFQLKRIADALEILVNKDPTDTEKISHSDFNESFRWTTE